MWGGGYFVYTAGYGGIFEPYGNISGVMACHKKGYWRKWVLHS